MLDLFGKLGHRDFEFPSNDFFPNQNPHWYLYRRVGDNRAIWLSLDRVYSFERLDIVPLGTAFINNKRCCDLDL